MKNAGVPVEAKVEAILPPICPLLPMPVTTTRPCLAVASNNNLCAARNASPSFSDSALTASASMVIVSRASFSVRSVSESERACNRLCISTL